MKGYKFFNQLIKNLGGVVDICDEIIFPYKGFDPRKSYKKEEYYKKALSNLENKNYIVKKDNKFYFTLKGKIRLLNNKKIKIHFSSKDWDRKWRILAFDIPEEQKRSRNRLRNYLYLLGFKMAQRSVWITPNKIDHKEIIDLFDAAIKEKILFFETDKLLNEKELIKKFNIK